MLRGLRSRKAAGLRLAPKEKIHLRKLYYLAAIRFSKEDYAGAADLLDEILRRNGLDEQANALKEIMIRKGILRDVLAKKPKGD